MLTNKEIRVLCYCRGCLNRKCGHDLERSDIKHLKRLNEAYPNKIRMETY